MPSTIDVVQVDAFTARPYAGNAAAVVLDAGGLNDQQMQAIAREMNLSETAFLTPTKALGANYRLRWMTPAIEVDFCGHATVATVHAMKAAGLLKGGHVVFETRHGLLPVALGEGYIWLEPAVPRLTEFTGALGDVLDALGMQSGDVDGWACPVLGGERDLLLPCRSLRALWDLRPNMARLHAIGKEHDWRGYCLTTLETVEPTSSTHSRFFAPQSGVDEDPVTGSVHASVAVYVTGAGKAPDRFTAEQGDPLARAGRLRIEVHRAVDGAPSRVRVGGQAVTVLRGTLQLPQAGMPTKAPRTARTTRTQRTTKRHSCP